MKDVQIYNTDDVQEYSSYSSAVSYANLYYITSESDTDVVKLVVKLKCTIFNNLGPYRYI